MNPQSRDSVLAAFVFPKAHSKPGLRSRNNVTLLRVDWILKNLIEDFDVRAPNEVFDKKAIGNGRNKLCVEIPVVVRCDGHVERGSHMRYRQPLTHTAHNRNVGL